MVHLAIELGASNPQLQFRIIQVDQFMELAEAADVQSTPTLVIAGQPARPGNLPPSHVIYYLWQAATGLA